MRGLRVFGHWRHRDQPSENYLFPSPCGDYGSSDGRRGEAIQPGGESFRPLAGITGLRTRRFQNVQEVFQHVSVPLRGLRVFGLEAMKRQLIAQDEFPSPCGDYGSSDWDEELRTRTNSISFRPLAGITGLRTGGLRFHPRKKIVVSVPLRGLRVFGPITTFRPPATGMSFRPLAGITGLRTPPHHRGCRDHPVFPSPCGDYGSSDEAELVLGEAIAPCFRPLAGITGLRTRFA